MSNIVLNNGDGVTVLDSTNTKAVPIDGEGRGIVNTYEDIANIRNPYLYMRVIVRNNSQDGVHLKGEYIITSLTNIGKVDVSGIKSFKEYVAESDPNVPAHVKTITQQNITDWNNSVPNTRTVNGKALSSNVQLTPSDIGAQPTIDNSHKLSADNIKDGNDNKVVTQDEKTTWNGKQDALTSEQLNNIANAIQMPSGASSDKVLGYANNAVAWVAKPSNGKSAYQIWYEENEYDDPTTYNEDYFLASLKAQFGSFVPAEYGTDGKPNDGSTDITASADTTNHIYLVDDDPDNPTEKVMWITVVEETNPQSPVYTWASIGTVNVNLKFDSGESINNVKIDDTQLDHPASNALAKAEDVMVLHAKLKGIDFHEERAELSHIYPGFIACKDNNTNRVAKHFYTSTESNIIVVPLNECERVRFLTSTQPHNNNYTQGCVFLKGISDIDTFMDGLENGDDLTDYITSVHPILQEETNNFYKLVEECLKADEDATHVALYAKNTDSDANTAITVDNIYCYLQTGETILDEISNIQWVNYNNPENDTLIPTDVELSTANVFILANSSQKSAYYYNDADEINIDLSIASNAGVTFDIRIYDTDGTTLLTYKSAITTFRGTLIKGKTYAGTLNNNETEAKYTGYIVIVFNKSSAINIQNNIVNNLNRNKISYRKHRGDSTPNIELKEKEIGLYGLKDAIISNNFYTAVQTDMWQTPREHSSIRVVMPYYLNLEWLAGFDGDNLSSTGRTEVRNGAIIDFSEYNSYNTLNRLVFRFNGNYREISKSFIQNLIDNGEIKLFIRGVEGDVISRNYDCEKYVKSLESKADKQYGLRDLPMIVHISDIHSDVTRFENAYKYAQYLTAHAFINSGDNCQRGYTNGIDWVCDVDGKIQPEPLVANKYVPFINCVGNHDTWKATNTNAVFNSLIYPLVDKYGYKKDSSTDADKTYYYYDLQVESPREYTTVDSVIIPAYTNIRFIVLDVTETMTSTSARWHISSEQINWFINTLNDESMPEDTKIFVVLHCPPDTLIKPSKVANTFNFKYSEDAFVDGGQCEVYSGVNNKGMPSGLGGGSLENNPIIRIMDAFIKKDELTGFSYNQTTNQGSNRFEQITVSTTSFASAKGEFVAYICGHSHRDYACYAQNAEKPQLVLCVTCGTAAYGPYEHSHGANSSDLPRKATGSTQDAFNVYVLDKQCGRIGIARVGSNMSCELRPRNVQWLNYKEVVKFTLNGEECFAVEGQTWADYINGENVPSAYMQELFVKTGIVLEINDNNYVVCGDKYLKLGDSSVSKTDEIGAENYTLGD